MAGKPWLNLLSVIQAEIGYKVISDICWFLNGVSAREQRFLGYRTTTSTMHFKSILLTGLTVLTSSVVADKLVTVEGCDADLFVVCGLYYSDWHTGFGVYRVNAHDGCRDTDIPAMTSLCVDWDNSRGHFYFENQPRRCFTKTSTVRFTGDDCWGIECWRSEWYESPCTW
ncbi:hypothetical protein AJ80_05608 [Polytolypa hystricis UAMH7299]|uniref:Secreted protein n=1 Tax=Polytolypa hystricis (strain UAMH7299) TaxID=1447883 RepID=A0A2B7Y233_POLH7|nr:hypothetical protein AJ80_05608 [Polytolypa hystricis UAMH7299]